MSDTIVVAVDTVNVSFNGQRWHIVRGSAWDASDPLVKAHPGVFTSDAGRHVHRTQTPVEQATAAPGERRTTRRNA